MHTEIRHHPYTIFDTRDTMTIPIWKINPRTHLYLVNIMIYIMTQISKITPFMKLSIPQFKTLSHNSLPVSSSARTQGGDSQELPAISGKISSFIKLKELQIFKLGISKPSGLIEDSASSSWRIRLPEFWSRIVLDDDELVAAIISRTKIEQVSPRYNTFKAKKNKKEDWEVKV